MYYVFSQLKKIDTALEKEMKDQVETKVTHDTSSALNKAWNELQYEVNCGYEFLR